MKALLLIISLLLPKFIAAQNNIAAGTWRTHYSFNTTISVTQSDQEVFGASASGVFIVNKNDKSISSLTKLNGLSETGISIINYNPTTKTVLISYDNGQIDLLREHKISSIYDIKLSDRFNSKISHQMYASGIYTYLSTDFGLIQIDTEARIIKESFLNLSAVGNNLKIYASLIYNDSLFLATETGVMAGSLADNLKDFSKWKRFDISTGISQETTNVLALYNGTPITGNTSQGLLQYKDGKWVLLGKLVGSVFTSIESSTKTLITASGYVYVLENGVLNQVQSSKISDANSAISDGLGYWVADKKNGLININSNSSESLYPNGPFFNTITNLKSVQNKIFALPNFKTGNGMPAKNTTGFSIFENGHWTNYNSTGYPNTESIPEFFDISGVSSLTTGELIFSSYGYGLLLWDTNNFDIIDDSNSPLINSSPPEKNVLIPDIDTDNTNLWVLNNDTNLALHRFAKEKTWETYTPSGAISNATKIVSTPWGDQWITVGSLAGGGIVVYNSSGAEILLKSSGLGSIPSNTVNQILLDKEDKIWIATKRGVVYYLAPYTIIDDPSQEAIIPIIDSRLLFNNENVNCLAVDGGNRLWMGTNKGAWLFANDGSELIKHFTTENSPLLSDIVLNIAINNLSGEVFFNTNQGLVSYRGSSTETGTFTKPKIFPNPITPNFTGIVTIEGVPTNSELKITDASGRLVANLKANGNSAIWDLNNSYSSKVGTGVYFVFISSDGTETQVGKIAIVK